MATKSNLQQSRTNTNTGAIKKKLVRNIQVPVNEQNPVTVLRHCERATPLVNSRALFEHTVGLQKHASKYQTPELQSCLGVAKKMEQIKSAPIPKAHSLSDLTPRSKAFITEQVNFYLKSLISLY